MAAATAGGLSGNDGSKGRQVEGTLLMWHISSDSVKLRYYIGSASHASPSPWLLLPVALRGYAVDRSLLLLVVKV